jgi:hypothetical protein
LAPSCLKLRRLHGFADGGRLRRTAFSGYDVEDAWLIKVTPAQNPGDLAASSDRLPPAGLGPPGRKAALSQPPPPRARKRAQPDGW